MELHDKLLQWADEEKRILALLEANKKLKAEIEQEVLATGTDLRLGDNMPKCIITSKGTFDWQSIAYRFEPDQEIIDKHTEIHWNKIAEEVAESDKVLQAVKNEYYTPGTPFAQCRLK